MQKHHKSAPLIPISKWGEKAGNVLLKAVLPSCHSHPPSHHSPAKPLFTVTGSPGLSFAFWPWLEKMGKYWGEGREQC